MRAGWEVVIGLEVHAQLSTRSKLFSVAPTSAAEYPNEHVTALCLGLPGALPRLNSEAVRLAIRAGLGLECAIRPFVEMARKSYFYADLPKGYQISQHDLPLCHDGVLRFPLDDEAQSLEIERIHIEEDAGKSVHDAIAGATVIDLNRAGVPLIEIVSRPGLRSAEAAVAAFAELRLLLMHLGVCDGSLESGSMRCDANVSVRPTGEQELRTRCELKNLNSLRALRDAIRYEANRQVEAYLAGESVAQQTRLWDADAGRTRAMRGKEDAADYRYMPDPDLPRLHLPAGWVDAERDDLPPSPFVLRTMLREVLALDPDAIDLLLESPEVLRAMLPLLEKDRDAARAFATFVFGPVAGALRRHGRDLSAHLDALAAWNEIFQRWRSGALSNKMLSEVLDAGAESTEAGAAPWTKALEAAGTTLSDPTALTPLISGLLAAHPAEVAEYRSGKQKLFGFFMGQAMRQTQGKADAATLRTLLQEALARVDS